MDRHSSAFSRSSKQVQSASPYWPRCSIYECWQRCGRQHQVVTLQDAVHVCAFHWKHIHPGQIARCEPQIAPSIFRFWSRIHEQNRAPRCVAQNHVKCAVQLPRLCRFECHVLHHDQASFRSLGRENTADPHLPHFSIQLVFMRAWDRPMRLATTSPLRSTYGSSASTTGSFLSMGLATTSPHLSPCLGLMCTLLLLCKLPADNTVHDVPSHIAVKD